MGETVFINFRGGIIAPDQLYNIMVAIQRIRIPYVRFGLRQQLMVELEPYHMEEFSALLTELGVSFTSDVNEQPNIISSYPAEDVFIQDTWLSETVYKDLLNAIDFNPKIKVNICDNNQSITPMLTGNINWIAAAGTPHYWHLFIRFPRTNVVYEWDQLTATKDLPKLTWLLDELIVSREADFIDNPAADGDKLFSLLKKEGLDIKPAAVKAYLPPFNLPYYEGLNRYGDKYWLGIYRRDEYFSVAFLKKLSQLCVETGISQLCCTAWKSILIKGINEEHKEAWNLLLEEFMINMRHAANELNFQVEDNSAEARELKSFIVKNLSIEDTRSFGLCIGIKTRRKSEIFSSILVRRRYVIDLPFLKLFKVYDILCAQDFNPNERTAEIYSSSNPKFVLAEQVRRSILKYYRDRKEAKEKQVIKEVVEEFA